MNGTTYPKSTKHTGRGPRSSPVPRQPLTEAQREILAAQRGALERSLETQLTRVANDSADIPLEWEREYRFHPKRRWRADFAWVRWGLLVEVEGGIFSEARTGHSSITGIKRDMEKGNAAAVLGWHILRFHRDDIDDGNAVQTIARWFQANATRGTRV